MTKQEKIISCIQEGRGVLGIEFGSTRIKAVLIDENHNPIAAGDHEWENRLENGVWTYRLEEIWEGLQDSYDKLAEDVKNTYQIQLTRLGAIGFSGMMHGYMAFDREEKLLVPFRTWRNTMTEEAAAVLSECFAFNIPQRWTVAHFYQAILNGEDHVRQVDFLTTLAGYLHWQLTGQKVLGIGDASGVFPIDSRTCDYDAGMLASFDELLAGAGLHCHLRDLLPRVLCAGQDAGTLTEAGARLLDPTGTLGAGIPLCPPEGDAGTGMAATDSVAVRTGNVSAGTSVFAMVVLEKPLAKVHPEIDLVTTPDGRPVAMVHCNTCTSDLDDWVRLLGEMAAAAGATLSRNELYTLFYRKALEGDPDCGGLVNFNCFSGEPVTGLPDGRPLLVRRPDARFTLANFARVQLYACLATLKYGLDILFEEEQVTADHLLGHGGLFKVPVVGQKLLAGALGVPVSVMQTAGEGGPWGMALLAGYRLHRAEGETLEQYLHRRIFAGAVGSTVQPDARDSRGFAAFMKQYIRCLAVERAAIDALP